MSGRRVHILTLAFCAAALCLAGCSEGGRVIPKKDMIDLYADMFLADQWLRENPAARSAADTTLFFDPIFSRHGYSFQDYEKSIEYYSGKTEELAEVMDSVSKRLKKRSEYYVKLSERISKVNAENERLRVDYRVSDFSDDSLAWAADGVLWPVRDSIPPRADSLECDAVGVLLPEMELLPETGLLPVRADSVPEKSKIQKPNRLKTIE